VRAPHEDREVPSREPRPPAARPPETASDAPAAASAGAPRLDRRSVQRLAAGGAGNKAVARLVAQRYAPVVKPPPAHAPGFRKTQNEVAAKKRHIGTHHPATTESKSAQDAAVAPPDDKEAQGKAAQAEKMNQAKPGGFDKAAFVKAVNDAIAKQAPKNLDEADKFSGSGKAEKVKGEVDGQVGQGKEKSAKDIATTTKAAPDTSKAKDKQVTPMQPDQAPANPGAPDPAGAVPDKQPAAVTDFSEGKQDTDRQMSEADVTDDQLKKGNEPEFDDALSAKKEGEQHSAKAPAQARTAEDKQRDAAKQGAAAVGTQAVEKLTATRQQAGKAVDGGKGDAKSKDEQKRAEVTAKLQKVFDATKKDVESTLSGLDKLVDDKFTAGEKAARDAFTADHKRRMKAYKDKRYSGFTGKLKWAKDKLLGMPAEANEIFAESRKLYVAKMQNVISDVADVIGTELGKAKDRISRGRRELKAEVDKLPADLRKFGEDAAKDFAGKFDDLDSQVDEKSQQLVTDLARKYTDALDKIDEEIKKLQEENKGLWDKVKDAVVGVIKTIMELKDMLLGVLAKAASAVMKIIKDPIGFLKNLVSAVGDGLQRFLQNIGDHLKKGLVSWLLGVSASAGIEIPSKFDLKGIIKLIASLLGLTWENIKSRITRKGVPDQAMTAVESSVPVASALAKEGPAGAVDHIAAEVGDLKATLLEKIASFLIPTVLIAGITWVISLFNPASAFVKAVKAIIDIVTFIVTQGAQIIEFVNTVLDAVIAIADGAGGGVPGLVENALAKGIPVLIGVLAALLGVGGLADKVKKAIQSVSKPVNRAIDKIVDKIATAGKRIWNKLKSKSKPTKDKLKAGKAKLKNTYASGKQNLKDKFGRKNKNGKDDDKRDDPRRKDGQDPAKDGKTDKSPDASKDRRPFTYQKSFAMAGESHTLYAEGTGGAAKVEMASAIRHNIAGPIASAIAETRRLRRSSGDDRLDGLLQRLDRLQRSHQKVVGSDYWNKLLAGDLRGAQRKNAEEWIKRQLNNIVGELIEIGQEHRLKSLEDFAALGHISDYVENMHIKTEYRNSAADRNKVRTFFYGGWTKDLDTGGTQRLAIRQALHDKMAHDRATWGSDPNFHNPDAYLCPACNTIKVHGRSDDGTFTLDHNTSMGEHWNSTGLTTTQDDRHTWYNNLGNLEGMCTGCNGKKSGPRLEYRVEHSFRGPGE
jgi:hypothetical protein